MPENLSSLPSGVSWMPVDEVLQALQSRCKPTATRETVEVQKALGRYLAEPALAERANPPVANSAVDGYGVGHESCSELASIPLVAGRAAAGQPFDDALSAGHAVRILTGAALPVGVDTVILQEEVEVEGEAIRPKRLPRKGANTRQAGEDVQKAEILLQAGHRLRPGDLALLAATGVREVICHARLRVGVLSTGTEIVEAGTAARDHQIFDANRPMLLATLERWGMIPVDLGHIADSQAELTGALTDAAGRVDAILTSGGASAGDEDHLAGALTALGALREWRVAVKPGRPLAIGEIGEVPVFGLPGNPVAAFVCSMVFVRPALICIAGGGWRLPEPLNLPAGLTKSKRPGRREYLRARLRNSAVEVFTSEGSGRISGLSWAEGLVELPDEAAEIQPGDLVRYFPFESFGL